jgi:hypothetical protein
MEIAKPPPPRRSPPDETWVKPFAVSAPVTAEVMRSINS